jgi:hypothetical protein
MLHRPRGGITFGASLSTRSAVHFSEPGLQAPAIGLLVTLASRPTLVRDITILLVVKVVLLFCGYWFFFGPQDRTQVTPAGIRDHLAPAVPATADPAVKEQP